MTIRRGLFHPSAAGLTYVKSLVDEIQKIHEEDKGWQRACIEGYRGRPMDRCLFR